MYDNIKYLMEIDKFYTDIVHALADAIKVSVPSIPHRALKDFWNDDLDYLLTYIIYGKQLANHVMDI